MPDLTDTEIAEMRRLAEKATTGPWRADDRFGCKGIRGAKAGAHRQAQYTEIAYTVGLANEEQDDANAAYIAAVHPQAVLALLDALAAAREAIRPFAEEADRYEPDEGDGDHPAWDTTVTIGDLRRARAHLPQARAAEEG